MDTIELRETLEKTGLTQYEADAYITIVELGSAPATEISNACDVPQARIYDVLRNLERKGHIETYEEGSLHARAHDPEEVVDSLTSFADTAKSAASEIQERWERPTVQNHRVSVLRPLSSIYDRVQETVEKANNEVQIAVTLEQYRKVKEVLAAAHERGVVVKLAITPAVDDDPLPSKLNFDFDGIATEVRVRELPTPLVVISDRMHVCYAPEEAAHPSQEYGILVNDYSLSRMFDWYFQTALWETWQPTYSEHDGGVSSIYTDARECIDDIAPVLQAGGTVILSVQGQRRDDGSAVELTGRVSDLDYVVSPEEGKLLSSFAEPATITLETPEETLTVGGWGALIEDIEGRRFIVEAIESPDAKM
ncbi:TrmB family transcriptional regulator [Haloferax marisrubri]|uniref:TrmB family transcriptional regulator n=1 Tax=Haloferax marisrubri TaxID=1544719 RepID=A0A2P4NM88_9EURY|nr:TrmB family transcriptional regulator [Haloferax marisrubri]POG54257.1 TrmB family transcriptional regulator [Haloferax marisrubri]